jgi:hemerythrin
VQWNEDYESGLSDIDVQHRYIMGLTNRVKSLQDAISSPEYRLLIDELASVAMCHFSCEEQIMLAYDYGETSKHVREHTKLLLEVRKYQKSEIIEPKQLFLFVGNWFVSHTLLEDRALAAHVIQRRARALGLSVDEYKLGFVSGDRPSLMPTEASAVGSKTAGQ